MKGIGIIAVVIGHCDIPYELLKFIFIWHMPLFFLIGGYFFRKKSYSDILHSIIKSLLIPYALTGGIIVVLTGIKKIVTGKGDAVGFLLGTLSGSGSHTNPEFLGGNAFIGAIWFLLALAWCRILYSVLCTLCSSTSKLFFASLSLSFMASIMGRHIYIPTDLLQGAASILFFCIGHLSHEYQLLDKIQQHKSEALIASFILLIIGMMMKPMSMVDNYYHVWPLNIVAAIGGCCTIYLISIYITQYTCCNILSYIGRISILVLSIHLIDLNLGIVNKLWSFSPNSFTNSGIPIIVSGSIKVALHTLFAISTAYLLGKSVLITRAYNLK